MKEKILSTEVSIGKQSVDFKQILELGRNKLRIKIKSDAYEFQSYAGIARWDGGDWKLVDSVRYSLMQTPHKLVYHPQYRSGSTDTLAFLADRDMLVKLAKDILL